VPRKRSSRLSDDELRDFTLIPMEFGTAKSKSGTFNGLELYKGISRLSVCWREPALGSGCQFLTRRCGGHAWQRAVTKAVSSFHRHGYRSTKSQEGRHDSCSSRLEAERSPARPEA
jgi:hypothetical protein